MNSWGAIDICPVCGAEMPRGERSRLSISHEEEAPGGCFYQWGGSRSTLLCDSCAAAVDMLLGELRGTHDA